MISLLYTSAAVSPPSEQELHELLAQSRENNAARDLTGMLLYRDERFFQVLEGPEESVRRLVETIEADPRHARMRVLLEEPITERAFGEWSMGFERMGEPTEPLPAGFRNSFTDLDEGALPGAVARAARELSMWFRVRAGGER